MLEIDNLVCELNGTALLRIDTLTINTATLTAILGPNGAGKSTLLKVLSGDYPYSGEVQFHGKDIQTWSRQLRARHLAVLPQASDLSFPFSAAEVVALGLIPLAINKADGQQRVREKMLATDCWQFAGRSYPSLSGGEKQRVQLARVLVQLSHAEYPPLLLLDEPTSAQDLNQQHKILELLSQLTEQQDYSVVAIIHDLNHAIRYCHRCEVVSQGEIIVSGEPGTILDAATVESVWRYRPQVIETRTQRILC